MTAVHQELVVKFGNTGFRKRAAPSDGDLSHFNGLTGSTFCIEPVALHRLAKTMQLAPLADRCRVSLRSFIAQWLLKGNKAPVRIFAV